MSIDVINVQVLRLSGNHINGTYIMLTTSYKVSRRFFFFFPFFEEQSHCRMTVERKRNGYWHLLYNVISILLCTL